MLKTGGGGGGGGGFGLEINSEKTKHMFTFRTQNARQNHGVKTFDKSSGYDKNFKYQETKLRYQNSVLKKERRD